MFFKLQKICFEFFKKNSDKTAKLSFFPQTGRYQNFKPIGAGGCGSVFTAWDSSLERTVAYKMIREENRESTSRAELEAKVLAKLSNPHIPVIYDIEKKNNCIGIIYQWIEGITLRQSLQQLGPLPISDVLKYFKDICEALSHSHSKNIIHRDIKPENIIIRQDCKSAVLVDFGIAFTPNRTERLTQPNQAIGTPEYMSPEQQTGGEIKQTSDIYNLSIVLYECLAGDRPNFAAYRSLTETDPGIPSGIDEVIRAGTAIDPSQRIQTAKEFYDRLYRCLNQNPSSAEDVFSQGTIFDIIKYIQNLSPADFSALTEGQKVLLSTKVKDLIEKDIYQMRNTVAKLLLSLIGVIHDEQNCNYYIEQALKYAFLTDYKSNWHGNPQLRDALISFASKASEENLKCLMKEIKNIIKEISKIPSNMHSLSYEMIKKTLESALARQSGCPDSLMIGTLLEEINEKLRNMNNYQ